MQMPHNVLFPFRFLFSLEWGLTIIVYLINPQSGMVHFFEEL